MVVLQLVDGIYYFSLNEEGTGEFSNTPSNPMIKFVMQRGPWEEIYYADINESVGDQLVCLQYKQKDRLTKTILRKFGQTKMMALSIKPQSDYDADNYKSHSLMMLDSKGIYQQLYFQDADSEPVIKMQRSIAKNSQFDAIMTYMNVNPWPMMIGDDRGMTVIQDQTITKEGGPRSVRSRATTISLNSPVVDHQ